MTKAYGTFVTNNNNFPVLILAYNHKEMGYGKVFFSSLFGGGNFLFGFLEYFLLIRFFYSANHCFRIETLNCEMKRKIPNKI